MSQEILTKASVMVLEAMQPEPVGPLTPLDEAAEVTSVRKLRGDAAKGSFPWFKPTCLHRIPRAALVAVSVNNTGAMQSFFFSLSGRAPL